MSAQNKWTPGPWKATKNAYGCNFVQRWSPGAESSVICGGNNHDTLKEADARLIAAAPDLYKALEAILFEDSDKSEGERVRDRVMARLALSKANGED